MSQLRADNYANRLGTKSVPADTVVDGTAKAWINFDGNNSTNRASFNVSSRTNNASGDYTINFTNAMPDANYAAVGMCLQNVNASNNRAIGYRGTSGSDNSAATTTSLRVAIYTSGGSLTDVGVVSVGVFR